MARMEMTSMAGLQRAVGKLEMKAGDSDMREAYLLIASDGVYRMGISIKALSDGSFEYSLELLICVLGPGRSIDARRLEDAARIAKLVEMMGYQPVYHDDGWACWEKGLARDAIVSEIDALAGVIDGPVDG